MKKIRNASEGDIITFGAYEQDNDTSNGEEDIEWLVLAQAGERTLVISRYALDCQPYNTSYESVTWETCSLNKWLNSTFIDDAFTTEEQDCILKSKVTADKNPNYDTPPGNSVDNKIFLLSIQEADICFSSDEERKCAPTDYANAQGVKTSDSITTGGRATCEWWLRSPGNYSYNAAIVNYDGHVYNGGINVNYDRSAVRPALWIKTTEENTTLPTTSTSDIETTPPVTATPERNGLETVEPISSIPNMPSAAPVQESRNVQIDKIRGASVGDYISFGAYEQDNDATNGKEEIEWLVLAKKNNRLLVISRYALECQSYNHDYTDVTWETCTLRKWLNGTFLNDAFTSEEQEYIPVSKVTADKNPNTVVSPGNATKDKVFLLSIAEANKYFNSDSARQCQATEYVKTQEWTKRSKISRMWWLRSPGYHSNYASFVDYDGAVELDGEQVSSNYAVRPAMWIEIGA